MVKKIFLSSMLILPLFSCNTDDDYEFNDIQGEYAVMQQSTNASKTRARAAAYSTSGWETVEYTGTPTFQTYNNQKIYLMERPSMVLQAHIFVRSLRFRAPLMCQIQTMKLYVV